MSSTENHDSAVFLRPQGLNMLCTRDEFLRHLRLALAASVAKQPNEMFAVLAINLSGFRNANKAGGHSSGDLVLDEAARRISQCIGIENLAAHDGGDDFFALIHYSNKETVIRPMLKDLSDALSEPYDLHCGLLSCPPRFGIASHPHDGDDAELLVRNAAKALQLSRSGIRGNTVFHNEGFHDDYAARMRMAEDLASAYKHNQFELHYQPIYSADTRLLIGAEALIRWNHPEHGPIGPEVFLADAKESGLIADIGQWAFTEVCRQIRAGIDAGQSIPVSLNITSEEIPESFSSEWMRQTMLRYRIPAGMLAFELKVETDSAPSEHRLRWMQDCLNLGIGIHIDDFDGSNPSLALVASGCVSEIRIGRELLRHLHTSTSVRTLIQAIIDYGRDSATRISAVGVEDESTANALNVMGCQSLQGYHLGHPSPTLRFPRELLQPKPDFRTLRLVAATGIRNIL
jgi:diguanylate cyclase